jgi:hypothetical protein
MHGGSLTTNDWSQFHYKVRVRPPVPPATLLQCIWGSSGLFQDVTFDKPIVLHIRNDLFGDPVTFGTQVVSSPPSSPPNQTTIIGTLQQGECVSIPLQGYSGVFATCAVESTVYCSIKASA